MVTEKRTYHHGDLRQALIEAALSVLEDEGISKMSLRSIARKAGVSQAAPYSHFADKNALLVEVAAYGFAKFREALDEPKPLGSDTDDLRQHLDALGVVYVEFALKNKSLFQLMFGDALSEIPKSEIYMSEGLRAYACIEKSVQKLTNDKSAPVAAWSMVHGLATLLVDNKIPVSADLGRQVKSLTRFLEF